jgi:Zn finger protein HypA/HybF involved in hydrogenase expression
MLLAACNNTSTATPTLTLSPRNDAAIRAAMSEGVHADTHGLGTGPNTYCARCKSPANWNPYATIDLPPNCVTCKFDSDTQMRVAEGNPLVLEQDWQGIRCYNCHPITENNSVEEAIAWWDPVADSYLQLDNSTELCEQCHRNSEAGTLRRRALAESIAHADATCTTCHDPHSGQATCSACHNEGDTETDFVANCWRPYLAPDAAKLHTDMLCQTCHDNAGLELRPVEDPAESYLDQWAMWRTTMIAGVIPSTHVWVSHNLTREVNCTRCHYAENPWGLAINVRTE